ncbi:glycosyltransferase family 2 protein [Flavobacterium cutihirudinis]|uniref:glycosyltransferase family 2 protein n=1 Tax=Flavobacterium cutihirudinis TaxID=1265740 RepID=UPI001ABFFAB3|nr:glycosyltransferase family 2 protein [Flavobacterium cutihirudinis]
MSIIIPTYNRSGIIQRTLDSVYAQNYQNWECIVVDDGSTDNTACILETYKKEDSRFSYLNRPNSRPKGASACRNHGLYEAKGRYVIFLDSDDVLLNTCLENRIFKIQENQGNDFWVFPMFVKNRNDNKVAVEIPIIDNYLIEFLSCRILWQTMCTIWDINFIKKINGFNELYPRLNDPEVHIRAMIESKDNFLVLSNMVPDSIYMIDTNADKNILAKKYATSLDLFIPDIIKKLNENGLKNESRYLRKYLSNYLLNFHSYNSHKNNLSVLKVFRENNVISFSVYVKIITQYYLVLIFSRCLKNSTKKIERLVEL